MRARRSAPSWPRRRASSSVSSTGRRQARRRRSRRRRRGSGARSPSPVRVAARGRPDMRATMPCVPVEPPVTPWQLDAPPDDHPDDLWALGADLEPGTLLAAYRLGLFPMPIGLRNAWFSPRRRAVVPLEPFAPSRSLRRAARGTRSVSTRRFPRSWLDAPAPAIRRAGSTPGSRTHTSGSTRSAGRTRSRRGTGTASRVGSTASRSAGSSPPSRCSTPGRTLRRRRSPPSSIACARRRRERRLLDVQWLTPHLDMLGAQEVTRAEYRRRLAGALDLPTAF